MNSKNIETPDMNFLEKKREITPGGRNRNEVKRQVTDVTDIISNYRRKPF